MRFKFRVHVPPHIRRESSQAGSRQACNQDTGLRVGGTGIDRCRKAEDRLTHAKILASISSRILCPPVRRLPASDRTSLVPQFPDRLPIAGRDLARLVRTTVRAYLQGSQNNLQISDPLLLRQGIARPFSGPRDARIGNFHSADFVCSPRGYLQRQLALLPGKRGEDLAFPPEALAAEPVSV